MHTELEISHHHKQIDIYLLPDILVDDYMFDKIF